VAFELLNPWTKKMARLVGPGLPSSRIGTDVPTLLMLVVLVATCATVGERFMRDATPGRGHWIEAMAGVWTVLLYVGLGAVPLAFAVWRGQR